MSKRAPSEGRSPARIGAHQSPTAPRHKAIKLVTSRLAVLAGEHEEYKPGRGELKGLAPRLDAVRHAEIFRDMIRAF
jgi:hypothetical protein